ncbi:conserved hypothetical protein [Mesorhizobium metallidurans STM 2683]|uniref:Uncharacterized protein n=1 Tax=Mesorhizobium metallidurans STM 2683 TaxID=1297569 RepID=M5F064_9HYPH|nr:conserved hypothetical protein [Mesorhizobium metallidurans STM 2683]
MKFEQIFSLRCHTEQAESFKLAANLYTNDQPTGFSSLLDTLSSQGRKMVEPDGIEPTTSCLQSRRSPS